MTTIIEGIGAGYGADPVLSGIDLEIAHGEVVSVLGPSGSGKTTLLRVIAGLHPADSGSIVIDGTDVTTLRPERRRIGLVPQDGALFPRLTVAANIGYGIRGLRGRAASRHPRVRELVELVGLDGLADRLPHQLSGGQQQRVALARALAPDPRLILLDEPFAALDADLRTRVREGVIEVLRAANVGALLITHDREEALSLSDRVAVLRAGRILQMGAPREIYLEPRDEGVARATGDAVVLCGVRVGDRARTPLGDLPIVAGSESADSAVRVLLRPGQLRLLDSPGESAAVGTVERVRYLGDGAFVRVRLFHEGDEPGSVVVTVVVPGDEPVPSVRARVGIAVAGAARVLAAHGSSGETAADENTSR